MTIQSYSDLKSQVVGLLHRPTLSSEVANFISRAETAIFRELDVKALETSVTGTTTGSNITLPTDFDQITRISVTQNGIEASLDYFAKPVDYVASNNVPNYFSFEGSAIRLHEAPGSTYQYTLYYIPVIAPLSDTNITNWLLANADDLYLYAAAKEGAIFVRNFVLADRFDPIISNLLDSVRRKTERKTIPFAGSLQIKPRR